uniref:Transmembrane protein 53 n=1 Tax=Glossina brevipalpis TaxID=37001 RepID=A0A1A9WHX6_9MUSC
MAYISRLTMAASRLCYINSPTSTTLQKYVSIKSMAVFDNVNSILKSTGFIAAVNSVNFVRSVSTKKSLFAKPQNCSHSILSSTRPSTFITPYYNKMAEFHSQRNFSTQEITKNLLLFTNRSLKKEVDVGTLELKAPNTGSRPLVLMMAWLMAKQKHLKHYAKFYTNLGFDVVVVQITPWQLLWPTKGAQVVAADTIKFLENNTSYEPIVVHGFSVGAYEFGEIMLQMSENMDRYSNVLSRIWCQIWDSAADITEIPIGLPKAIFPKNLRMQNALRSYTLYHLKTFHSQATIHYIRSSQMFHSTILKKPALFLVSENDPVGPPSSNKAVSQNWERANIKVTFQCWKRSEHAAHFVKHRDEYTELLVKHLEESGVLETVNIREHAKL